MDTNPLQDKFGAGATGPDWASKRWARSGIIAVIYVVLYILLDSFMTYSQIWPSLSVWYTPSGLTLAVLMGLGLEYIPVAIAASVLTAALNYHLPLLTSWSCIPLSLAFGTGYGCTTAIVIKVLKVDMGFTRIQDVGRFVPATLAGSLMVAVLGVACNMLDGSVKPPEQFIATINWWLGDAVAINSLTPFLLVFVLPAVRKWREEGKWRWMAPAAKRQPVTGLAVLEFMAQGTVLFASAWVVFELKAAAPYQPLYLCFIPIIWVASRRGVRGAASATLAFGIIIMLVLRHINASIEVIQKGQLLTVSLCLTGMILGAVVTERGGALKSLSQSEDRYRDLVENSGIYVGTQDLRGTVLSANVSALRIFGCEQEEEFVGHNLSEFMFHEDLPKIEPYLQALKKIGRVSGLLNVRTRKGERKIIEFNNSLRQETADKSIIRCIGHDVTDRTRAENALRRSEARVRLLLDSTAEAIYGIDVRGKCTFANAACLRMLGYERLEDVLGRKIHELIHHTKVNGSPYPASDCRISKAMMAGEGVHVADEVLWRADGTCFPAEYWSFPVRNGKKLDSIVVTFLDITDRKKAETDLRQAKESAEFASRAKSEFLANMSHEIRTPMNGIMGMTELALETELTGEQREYLEIVQSSSESLLRLINDILDFSKIEAGKLALDPIEFDLRNCLSNVNKSLSILAREKGLKLVTEISPSVPQILVGDPARLRQILVNLVGNSIKFTEQGQVIVSVQTEIEQGDQVFLHFTVADTGIGIPKDRQKSIFEAFTQADSSTTRKYGGTGLGLTITSRLVEMMGGRVWVESEPAGGAKFHFTAKFAHRGMMENLAPQLVPAEFGKVRVLVVDGNAPNLRSLEGMLQGMVTASASSAQGALEALSRSKLEGTPFALVVTDSGLPDMDGFQFVENIRRDPAFSATPVVMVSAAGQRGDAARCRKLGVCAYLARPISHKELREAIATAVSSGTRSGAELTLMTRHSIRESRRTLRILLAEDNHVNQWLAVRLLEKRGHQVVTANDGKEALDILQAADFVGFDLVLMDIQMPGMDGYEATAFIREHEKESGGHLPVIALTAHAFKEDQERCMQAGMDGFLAKPLRAEELYRKINMHTRLTADTSPNPMRAA